MFRWELLWFRELSGWVVRGRASEYMPICILSLWILIDCSSPAFVSGIARRLGIVNLKPGLGWVVSTNGCKTGQAPINTLPLNISKALFRLFDN